MPLCSEKELLYAAAVESADDAISTNTLNGIITTWNPAAQKLYGYTEQEAIGESIDIIVPEEARSEIKSIHRRIQNGGRVDHYETVRINKNKQLINVSLTVSPVKSSLGSIIGVSAIARDITEKKQIETQIIKNEAPYSISIESSSEIIWITDLTGKPASFLPDQLNFDEESFEQREAAFYESVHPDDYKTVKEFRQKVLETQTSAEIEFRCWNQNGDWRQALLTAVPLTDKEEIIHGWVGIKTDITRQKRLITMTIMQFHKSYEQLRYLTTQMTAKIEKERQRIAIEVHDQIGGNLVQIKHHLEHLINAFNNQSGAVRPLETLKNLTNTQTLVVQTIHTAKEISAKLHPAELDYLGLVVALKSEAESFSKHYGIACNFEFETEETWLSKEQETAIFRVFQEVLRNILLHAKATKINIYLATNDSEFQLSVEDNGRGISEKEKFAEVSLGLLGMNERIEQIGGTFMIKGVEGSGTTVRVRVPFEAKQNEGED